MAAVGHVARVEQHGVVEQRRAAFVDRLHLAHHFREERGVPRVDLAARFARNRIGVLDFAGVALVLQRVAVPLVADGDHAGKHRLVAARRHRHDARRVRLKREDHHIRHEARCIRRASPDRARSAFAHFAKMRTRPSGGCMSSRWPGILGVERFLLAAAPARPLMRCSTPRTDSRYSSELLLIGAAEPAVQRLGFSRHEVDHALIIAVARRGWPELAPDARAARPVRRDRRASAKHPVEDQLRIRLGRHRLAIAGERNTGFTFEPDFQ